MVHYSEFQKKKKYSDDKNSCRTIATFLKITMQETFSPFSLCLSCFPVPRTFIEPPDSKIRLNNLKNNCGMCRAVLLYFTILMAYLFWQLHGSLSQDNSS